MEDKWLNDIHDRMGDFQVEEPDGLWNNIESELKRASDIGRPTDVSAIMMAWIRCVAAVAAVLAVCLSISYWGGNIELSPPGTSLSVRMCGAIDDVALIQTGDFVHEKDVESSENKGRVDDITICHHGVPDNRTAVVTVDENNLNVYEKQIVENIVEPDGAATDTVMVQQPVDVSKDREMHIVNGRGNNLIYTKGGDDRPAGRLAISAYTSGGFNSSFNQASAGIQGTSIGPDNTDWKDSPKVGVLLFNHGKDIVNEVRHRLPVRTGISFDYRINDRLSLGTGVTYTNLTSDLKFGSESHCLSGIQTLHYVGLPLNVRYSFLRWHKLEMYASAGVLVEKCVSGKTKQTVILDHEERCTQSESTKVRSLQWSTNVSAGFQFNASSVVGLYVEPGMIYYYDNGSPIKTVYKDRPFNFNLNIGLRFTVGKDR